MLIARLTRAELLAKHYNFRCNLLLFHICTGVSELCLLDLTLQLVFLLVVSFLLPQMAALDELLHAVAMPYHHELLLPAYTQHHIAVLLGLCHIACSKSCHLLGSMLNLGLLKTSGCKNSLSGIVSAFMIRSFSAYSIGGRLGFSSTIVTSKSVRANRCMFQSTYQL